MKVITLQEQKSMTEQDIAWYNLLIKKEIAKMNACWDRHVKNGGSMWSFIMKREFGLLRR